jgi:hypothetical protein
VHYSLCSQVQQHHHHAVPKISCKWIIPIRAQANKSFTTVGSGLPLWNHSNGNGNSSNARWHYRLGLGPCNSSGRNETVDDEYGSEYCEANGQQPDALSLRALRRKFLRWFPLFFHWFYYDASGNLWVPRLGEQEEIKRRKDSRAISEELPASLRAWLDVREQTSYPMVLKLAASLLRKTIKKKSHCRSNLGKH